jgi:hypothetical protein
MVIVKASKTSLVLFLMWILRISMDISHGLINDLVPSRWIAG